MTCVKNNNFSGFTPHFTLVYIFVSCVFYTVHYIRDQKKTRTVLYSCMIYIFIHFHCAKSKKKKKNYLLIFIHYNGEIIMPNFFFQPLQANMGQQQRLSFYIYIYIYINLYIMFVSRPLSHTHSLSV